MRISLAGPGCFIATVSRSARAWEATRRFVQERETDLQTVLDVFEFQQVLGRLFQPPR